MGDCFDLTATLACSNPKTITHLPKLDPKRVTWLENRIDEMNKILPELKSFIIPSGSLASGHTHLARAICRRAERELVTLSHETEIPTNIKQYLNRLSDFLFVLARYLNHKQKIKDRIRKTK